MAATAVFEPGIMISQTWPTVCDSNGATLDAFHHVIEDGFFRAVQTVHVPESAERRRIAELVGTAELLYTYTLSRLQNQRGLNLSSLNHADRKRAVESVTHLLDDAREAGAGSVCVVSGARPPGVAERTDALKSLHESMMQIAENAMIAPRVELLIEPLDYFADKRHSLGSVQEGLDLCNSVNLGCQRLGLCVDTAHMMLNGEYFAGRPGNDQSQPAPAAAEPNSLFQFVREFHFCNAVIAPHHPLFGDRHLTFGEPGSLSESDLGGLLTEIIRLRGARTEPVLRVYCEVLNSSPSEAEAATVLYRYVRTILKTLSEATDIIDGTIETNRQGKKS